MREVKQEELLKVMIEKDEKFDWDSMYTRNWHQTRDCDYARIDVHLDYITVASYQNTHRMTHLPNRNPMGWRKEAGPAPQGYCYDLHCDDFFDKNGNFNFDAWKEYDENHPFFVCESFVVRSQHKCGYALFSKILQDGLEFWLDGKEPATKKKLGA